MIEKLVALDQKVFVYLNGLGSEQYDALWSFITKQINWIPVFLLIFYIIFKKLGWRHTLMVVLVVSVLIALTDQTTNLIKYSVQRLRPCNEPAIKDYIRIVISRQSFSFVSGHASNSMAAAILLYLIMKPYVRYMGLIFLWPLIFAYSRIYLGLHYPLDILCGFALGTLTAFIVYQLYKYLRKKYFPESLFN
ncbi:phosphatase PAP2 family protein [Flavobacterium sp. '19STA2R22 D10 B1']|uniref:phosphatase PAP2 family protein n=1 Tax=Flavobacterium aerium TaxID=3037261 RepID=UPI00278C77BE|nr:phosphatase PAP2 family protein [Flavobacterium sp. '19STA2R22 D10 B1']